MQRGFSARQFTAAQRHARNLESCSGASVSTSPSRRAPIRGMSAYSPAIRPIPTTARPTRGSDRTSCGTWRASSLRAGVCRCCRCPNLGAIARCSRRCARWRYGARTKVCSPGRARLIVSSHRRCLMVTLRRPQFSWIRIKGESDVKGGGGHGWVEASAGSGVGADGGSPEGERSRRRRRGGWGGGLGARAAVEREPETGRGSAAAARRVAGDGLARSRGRALSPGGVAGAGAGRSRARSEGAGR